jgi:hypothetical protein
MRALTLVPAAMSPRPNTRTLGREIDELLYALYGLTPEEKALVQAAAT